MKYLGCITALILAVVSFACGQVVHNPHFTTSLDTWNTFVQNTQWNETLGTAVWDSSYGGSAKLVVDGDPGIVGMMQATCAPLYTGDSIWLDVWTSDMQYFAGLSFYIGGEPSYNPAAQETVLIEPPPGYHHLVIIANKLYPAGTAYMFHLTAFPGRCTAYVRTGPPSSIEEDRGSVKSPSHAMLDVRPNPANRRIGISYELPRKGQARLQILDRSGRVVTTLFDKEVAAGRHDIIWNGISKEGNPVPAGTYFYTLVTNGDILTRKVIIVK
jgi:hypothetical protein